MFEDKAMVDRRMLILPAELVRKIDENRGDMGQAEFIDFLINSQFNEEETNGSGYVTTEEFHTFEQGMKELFRSFLDFFLNFGLEMGHDSSRVGLEVLSDKLHGLEEQLDHPENERRAKIKWK